MTVHINAQLGDIAPFVLMPGDPLRAKDMAYTYLVGVRLVNDVRGMLMFTGTYRNVPITIAASGMGNGSMGIYSYELFQNYGVENIVRVGTCGAYKEDYELSSIFNCRESYDDGSFARVVLGSEQKMIPASTALFNLIAQVAEETGVPTLTGAAHCSDVFYRSDDVFAFAREHQLDVVEMETAALFTNALKLHKQAAALLTVSDNLATDVHATAGAREKEFSQMFELALEVGYRFYRRD